MVVFNICSCFCLFWYGFCIKDENGCGYVFLLFIVQVHNEGKLFKKGLKMKKTLLAGLALGVLMVGLTGVAQAIPLTDVGNIDHLLYSTTLPNSAEQTEVDWVNSKLGTSYTTGDYFQEGVGASDWTGIDGYTGVFACALTTPTDYFLVKIGNNSGSAFDTFLFNNLDSLSWAVIDLGEMGFNDRNISNIGKVSHLGEFAGSQVPEPATMFLFGTGLAGLAGSLLRRKKD